MRVRVWVRVRARACVHVCVCERARVCVHACERVCARMLSHGGAWAMEGGLELPQGARAQLAACRSHNPQVVNSILTGRIYFAAM